MIKGLSQLGRTDAAAADGALCRPKKTNSPQKLRDVGYKENIAQMTKVVTSAAPLVVRRRAFLPFTLQQQQETLQKRKEDCRPWTVKKTTRRSQSNLATKRAKMKNESRSLPLPVQKGPTLKRRVCDRSPRKFRVQILVGLFLAKSGKMRNVTSLLNHRTTRPTSAHLYILRPASTTALPPPPLIAGGKKGSWTWSVLSCKAQLTSRLE